jgi:hypothetical protein
MAIRGKDGLSGGTGGSRAFINNLNRVRKNTNAVAGVVKPDSPTAWRTGPIQRNSVKKVVGGKTKENYPTKNELGIGDKKTVVKPAPKKVVAKKAVKQKTNGLSAKAERGINWEKLNRLDRLN